MLAFLLFETSSVLESDYTWCVIELQYEAVTESHKTTRTCLMADLCY